MLLMRINQGINNKKVKVKKYIKNIILIFK